MMKSMFRISCGQQSSDDKIIVCFANVQIPACFADRGTRMVKDEEAAGIELKNLRLKYYLVVHICIATITTVVFAVIENS